MRYFIRITPPRKYKRTWVVEVGEVKTHDDLGERHRLEITSSGDDMNDVFVLARIGHKNLLKLGAHAKVADHLVGKVITRAGELRDGSEIMYIAAHPAPLG